MSKESITSRNKALDGLRGIAALIVVIHHTVLTNSWFADRVGMNPQPIKGHFNGGLHGLVEYTPLHIFYAGTEAVVIFFVLSGYVLPLGFRKNRNVAWLKSRLIRLYFPIFGAVSLATVIGLLVKRDAADFESWWMKSHAVPPTITEYLRNIWVLDGTNWLDSSLWSMKYEIVFSMVVLVFAGFSFKNSLKAFVGGFVVASAAIGVGIHYSFDLMGWLPVFFVGSILHFKPIPKRFVDAQFVIGIFVILIPWYFAGFGYGVSGGLTRILMTLGAVLIVNAARSESGFVRGLLAKTVPQKLGRWSYALYLIHAPVLVTVFYAMGPVHSHAEMGMHVLVAWIFIAVFTWFVYTCFEKPVLGYVRRGN